MHCINTAIQQWDFEKRGDLCLLQENTNSESGEQLLEDSKIVDVETDSLAC